MPFLSTFSSSSSSRVESPSSPSPTPSSKPPPVPSTSHQRKINLIRRSHTLQLDKMSSYTNGYHPNYNGLHSYSQDTSLSGRLPQKRTIFQTRPLKNLAYSGPGNYSGTSTPISFVSRSPSPCSSSIGFR